MGNIYSQWYGWVSRKYEILIEAAKVGMVTHQDTRTKLRELEKEVCLATQNVGILKLAAATLVAQAVYLARHPIKATKGEIIIYGFPKVFGEQNDRL